MADPIELGSNAELALRVLVGESVEVNCLRCGVQEWVVPLDDLPIDEAFCANYHCNDCDSESEAG